MLAIGLMSGTSLDGVDAALVDVSGVDFDTKVKLLDFLTLPMPQETQRRILEACSLCGGSASLICTLNVELGHLFSEAVSAICRKAGIDDSNLDFVASHGQTIWHNPVAGGGRKEPGCEMGKEESYSGTLQIGEPSLIAFDHNVTVISDFRPMDMAAGGQGAPLVPFSEVVIYGNPNRNVALLNIGGISNLTVLPKGKSFDNVFAFDTGPGNMMVDEACRRFFQCPYDESGKISRTGKIDEAVLSHLTDNPYFDLKPPKSTGRELFGAQALDSLVADYPDVRPQDLVATLTMFTAKSIADACHKFVEPVLDGGLDRLVVGGGGAHNVTLMSDLANLLSGTEVMTQEDLGFSSDAKEAIAFAVLGNQTLKHRPSNVPSATGASCPVVLGNIIYPPRLQQREGKT